MPIKFEMGHAFAAVPPRLRDKPLTSTPRSPDAAIWSRPVPASYVHFTARELVRMHLHLFHPSPKKSFALLKRATPDRVTGNVRAMLEKISKHVTPFFGSRRGMSDSARPSLHTTSSSTMK